MTFNERSIMNRQPVDRKNIIIVLNIAFVLALGIADYFTDYHLNFFVFYFFPIAIAAWYASSSSAYVISLLSALSWSISERLEGSPNALGLYLYWNTGVRLLTFLLIGYFISRIKFLLAKEKKLSLELQDAVSQIKTMRGLLPICAKCKKIRNDDGYWQHVEEYIEKNSDARFTHSYCRECARDVLEEAGIEEEKSGKENE